MSLKIDGLPTISQLSKGDQVLVMTKDGIKSLNAEVLGAVFSNTSLFETYNMVELSELNVQNISTHNKVRKYLSSDTSAEVYLEYFKGQINIIKSVVLTDSEHQPMTIQATDLRGNQLYWSEDISSVEFFDGLPWKNKDDEKVFITTEKTEFPVTVYQYSAQYLRKSEISFDASGEPTLTDIFFTKGSTSRGIVEKQGNSFLFQLRESGKDPCGIQISLNEDGTVSGKLLGIWEGVNDWDIEDVLTKPEFKEWFYTNLDYNMYANVLSVNTADMIGWYLTQDTSNHVITEVSEGIIKVYLAQNKTSGAGSYVQEQARNKLGQPLYWKADMTYQSGVSSEHIPIHNGQYVFMTIEETEFPVYIYQYNYTDLFSVTTEVIDGVRSTKLLFSGLNGKTGEIYKNSKQFIMRYLNTDGEEYSKIVLGETESELTGKWKAGNRVISSDELPTQSSTTKDQLLKSDGAKAVWIDLDTLFAASETIKNLTKKVEELEKAVKELSTGGEPAETTEE